jgi:hypothetical protein
MEEYNNMNLFVSNRPHIDSSKYVIQALIKLQLKNGAAFARKV